MMDDEVVRASMREGELTRRNLRRMDLLQAHAALMRRIDNENKLHPDQEPLLTRADLMANEHALARLRNAHEWYVKQTSRGYWPTLWKAILGQLHRRSV